MSSTARTGTDRLQMALRSRALALLAAVLGLPDRTILEMRLGHDAEAAADARQRVIAFLAANGVPSPNRAR